MTTNQRQGRVRQQTSRISLRGQESLTGWAFITPQLAGFLIFVAGPIVAILVFAFMQRNLLVPEQTFVGLANFERELASPFFRRTVVNSAVFSLGLVPINIGLALAIALLLSRGVWGGTGFRILFFLPVVTSGVAWAIVWLFLLQGEGGPINQQLARAGIEGPNWLRSTTWAMPSVILTRAIKTVGLKVIILTAAIRNIPREVIESSRIDGASEWKIVVKMIVPLLGPILFVLTVWTLIGSFQAFDHILLMTNGGPENATFVLVLYIYRMAFQAYDVGIAATAAVVLFVIVLGLTIFQFAVRKRLIYSER